MNLYSPYDYLAFILPGGTVLFAAIAGLSGLPSGDIGLGFLVVLLAAAFLAGHLIAAIASFLEPLAWGHQPGTVVDPTWGLLGRYTSDELASVQEEFEAKYGPGLSFVRLYQLAYTDLQAQGRDGRLSIFNSQISFYRNGSVAFAIALGIQLYLWVAGQAHIETSVWAPLFAAGALGFALRYKRFWGQFGDNVIRGFRILARAEPSNPTST